MDFFIQKFESQLKSTHEYMHVFTAQEMKFQPTIPFSVLLSSLQLIRRMRCITIRRYVERKCFDYLIRCYMRANYIHSTRQFSDDEARDKNYFHQSRSTHGVSLEEGWACEVKFHLIKSILLAKSYSWLLQRAC